MLSWYNYTRFACHSMCKYNMYVYINICFFILDNLKKVNKILIFLQLKFLYFLWINDSKNVFIFGKQYTFRVTWHVLLCVQKTDTTYKRTCRTKSLIKLPIKWYFLRWFLHLSPRLLLIVILQYVLHIIILLANAETPKMYTNNQTEPLYHNKISYRVIVALDKI